MEDRMIFSSIESSFDEALEHYGTKYHSGRYPYGSGEDPYQHDPHASFYAEYKELKNKGMTEGQIAKYFDERYYGNEGKFKSTQLRAKVSIGKDAYIAQQRAHLLYLTEDRQMSVNAASKAMGITEGTARNYLKDDQVVKISSTRNLANRLADDVEQVKYLDVGHAINLQYGVSKTQLDTAIEMLKSEGYRKHYISVPQATNPLLKTSMQVLTKDDVPWKEVNEHRDEIKMNPQFQPKITDDGEWTAEKIPAPKSVSLDRIEICYGEDGGAEKDGVIEIRPGVADLDLGENNYAQVRIKVDNTHYLKGMAIYSNNIPEGKDIVFNTHKDKDTPVINFEDKDNQILKPLKKDEDLPFGAVIQRVNYNEDTGEQTAINIVNDDTDWEKWSKNLASQFLSKQEPQLVKQQLNITYTNRLNEYEELSSLTNPTIKKKLLMDFADQCESDACTLKAAPLPRQATKVILPVTSLKDGEVYAPTYKNGEEVILVRYPHGGRFEIPRLTVNNLNKEGKELLGNSEHAIGINGKAAKQLSGADFDGDTVVVIPTKGQNISTKDYYKELADYDHLTRYKAYDGMTRVGNGDGFKKQFQMGSVSNLITDMTIGGAKDSEIVRAVKHSMTIIDAEKHNLNWKLSEEENGIKQLKEKYQGGKTKGASTLISKASSEVRPDDRKQLVSPNTMTDEQKERYYSGKKVYEYSGKEYLKLKDKKVKLTDEQKKMFYKDKATFEETGVVPEDHDGLRYKTEKVKSKETSTRMAETDDATTLISDANTIVENLYANHANKLKSLAQTARKEAIATPPLKYDAEAKKVYSKEVKDLDAKLANAKLNAPLERQAQAIASKKIEAKKAANPDWDSNDIKKASNKAINEARLQTGAKKHRVEITDREWEAIQAGAVTNTKLTQILYNSDTDKVRQLATPRKKRGMTTSQISRAKALLKKGYTQAEVAEFLGVSTTTISNNVNVNAINKEVRESKVTNN